MPSPCILLVDDDRDVRETVAECLEAAGYKTVQADNGRGALDMLAQVKPCLILLDMIMPVMSGSEFCEKIAADPKLTTLPIVLVAGGQGYLCKPARRLIRKPISMDTLLGVVQEFCGPPPV